MYWRKDVYSLRAGILVWYFTFYTGNSKPDCMLARFTSNVIIRLTLIYTFGKSRVSVFSIATRTLSTDGRCAVMETKFTLYWTKEAIACEQELWFGISRFMRETPHQKTCLAGPQRNMIVILTSFDKLGQHKYQKKKNRCFCGVLSYQW